MNLKNIQHKIDKNRMQFNNLLNVKIQKQNILIEELKKMNIELCQKIAEKDKTMVTMQKEMLDAFKDLKHILTERNDLVKQSNLEIKEKINKLEQTIQEVKGISKEILWGEIFNNTIFNSSWLTDKSFSPGRWAVGYQYLYSVYRILNIAKPKSILELGLGQSTKLLSQYAQSNREIKHIVVEHDPEWIEFYKQENNLTVNTKILKLERIIREYKGDNNILAFKDFKESLHGLKFDFISIDAPLGAYGKVYARIDILEILPDCLNEDFVIIIDDYNRNGEKHTVNEIEQSLKRNGIVYVKGIYYGEKQCMVICSEKLKFICSM